MNKVFTVSFRLEDNDGANRRIVTFQVVNPNKRFEPCIIAHFAYDELMKDTYAEVISWIHSEAATNIDEKYELLDANAAEIFIMEHESNMIYHSIWYRSLKSEVKITKLETRYEN